MSFVCFLLFYFQFQYQLTHPILPSLVVFILFECALSLTIIYICNAVSDLVTLLSILVLSLIYVFFYFSFISLLSTMSSSA